MEIDGRTRVCGLLGCPVEHTKSPLIHNLLAELENINSAYLPFLVERENLADAVKGAYALNVLGLNVTVPHKEKVLPFLQEIDPLAKKIGAVNTLVRMDGGYKGYNTDMPGLYRALQSDNIRTKDRPVVILGAGGVARAVAVMLSDKVPAIYILNRTVEKAETIAEEINGYTGKRTVSALPLSEYENLPGRDYLAIQATNVGMYPHTDEAVIEDTGFYEKIQVGYDLIYNPSETKFMQLVRAARGQAYNGLKMLLYQGIIAFELWNQVEISEAQAKKVYDRLKECI